MEREKGGGPHDIRNCRIERDGKRQATTTQCTEALFFQ